MHAPFPEIVRFRGPTGLTEQLAALAEREQLSVSALCRRLVVEQVERRKAAQRDDRSEYAAPRELAA